MKQIPKASAKYRITAKEGTSNEEKYPTTWKGFSKIIGHLGELESTRVLSASKGQHSIWLAAFKDKGNLSAVLLLLCHLLKWVGIPPQPAFKIVQILAQNSLILKKLLPDSSFQTQKTLQCWKRRFSFCARAPLVTIIEDSH